MKNFTSRKFLISLAAFLGSVAASIAGIATADKTIATVGIVCGVLSAAIYAACEAYVDGKAVGMTFEDDAEEEEDDEEPKW